MLPVRVLHILSHVLPNEEELICQIDVRCPQSSEIKMMLQIYEIYEVIKMAQ